LSPPSIAIFLAALLLLLPLHILPFPSLLQPPSPFLALSRQFCYPRAWSISKRETPPRIDRSTKSQAATQQRLSVLSARFCISPI
jgi:hypothetical protein